MTKRFFVHELPENGSVEVTGPDAHHISRVLRLGPGDSIELFDGKGREATARIIATGKNAVSVDVVSIVEVDRELDVGIELAMPMPKSARQQFLIEKLTELGVRRFVPLTTEHASVLKSNREKLLRYSMEACKQSRRNRLLDIQPMTPLTDYLPAVASAHNKFLFEAGGRNVLAVKRNGSTDDAVVHLLIGPEGGFSSAEVQLAKSQGWTTVSAGNRVLRMETAALFATIWAADRFSAAP